MHAGAEDVDADDMEGADMEGADMDVEDGDLAPQAQVILTGCWLTMKEVSLLLGTLAACAPLPGTLTLHSTLTNSVRSCRLQSPVVRVCHYFVSYA